MTDHIEGKGFFIWKIKNAAAGDGKTAAEMAHAAGLTHVVIKILDGIWGYNQRPFYDSGGNLKFADDILKPFIDEFKSLGIQVWGYQWVYLGDYGSSPTAEAQRAKERVADMGVDGFVINAESHAKNNPVGVSQYVENLKGVGVPVALSTYRYPTLHYEIDYQKFIEICDFVMPQVYWLKATNSAEQLARSLGEWGDITNKPIIPTGAAFSEWGWVAQPGEIVAFLQAAFDGGLPGANFWEWNEAVTEGLFETVSTFPWPVEEDPPPGVELMNWKRFLRWKVFPFMKKRGYTGPAPDILGK